MLKRQMKIAEYLRPIKTKEFGWESSKRFSFLMSDQLGVMKLEQSNFLETPFYSQLMEAGLGIVGGKLLWILTSKIAKVGLTLMILMDHSKNREGSLILFEDANG
jgi:hypothetical protein